MKGRFGKEHPTSRPVMQYSKDGEFIAEYGSIIDAAITLGIIRSNISSCCTGRNKIIGGFVWKYKYQ